MEKMDDSSRRKQPFNRTSTNPDQKGGKRRRSGAAKNEEKKPPLEKSKSLERHVLAGLTVAGVGCTLLRTVVYQVEGNNDSVFTANPGTRILVQMIAFVSAGWWTDHVAARRRRTDVVGIVGLALVLAFFVFMFLWIPWLYEGLHVLATVVLASSIIEDYRMPYPLRIRFMISGQFANLLASLTVRSIYRTMTEAGQFRLFLTVLLFVVAILFVVAQNMIEGAPLLSIRFVIPHKVKVHDDSNKSEVPVYKKQVRWRAVLRDISRTKSFRAWIIMEGLLEAQLGIFRYLLSGDGWIDSESTDTWAKRFLSDIRPLKLLAVILTYIPMGHFGYSKVYKTLFFAVILNSLYSFAMAEKALSTERLLIILLANSVTMTGVRSSGFQLALADLAVNLKHNYLQESQRIQPAYAGLLIGANALFCKPMEFIFTLAATIAMTHSSDLSRTAFSLLTITPFLCSCVQLIAWRNYSLTSKNITTMREDLNLLVNSNIQYAHV